MLSRCKNLDKHRRENYWTLPEEMAARAFEVYLKSKLEEKNIRNDYLVNFRSEESWEKATEKSFKMEDTYPYPTATEMEDIKTAYEFLFDSIRFKMHDKNCELYSASAENISEMLKESKLLLEKNLNSEQIALKKMSEEVFDIEVKYFEGSPKFHGRYDDDKNIIYINSDAETSLDWTFWHEAFHIMKNDEPELYEDILKHVESCEIFTSQQIENYRQSVNQSNLKKSQVVEEMLADAFADMKTGHRIVEKMSEKNRSLAEKFVDFTKKLFDGVKNFFKAKEVREKYPEVALTNKQFKNFVQRVDENICGLQNAKKISVGYKILQSPYKYSPKKQKKFDVESAAELTKKYSAESVKNLIQNLSPLGRKNKNYGREILQEVRMNGR